MIPRPKTIPTVVGHESLTVACGHAVVFPLWKSDPYRNKRREDTRKKKCPECRQRDAANLELRQKQASRLKKLATRGWWGRLPAGSKFKDIEWDGRKWRGDLWIPNGGNVPGFVEVVIVEPLTFHAEGNSLKTFINRTDKLWRQWLVPRVKAARSKK